MNVAFFLMPKANVAWLFEDVSVPAGLEKLRDCGYTAIPVLSREGQYIGTVTEGDFLHCVTERWFSGGGQGPGELEQVKLRDIMRSRPNPPVLITAGIEELIDRAVNQNFVPVVDDRNAFVGIVTRKAIISNLASRVCK